MKDGVTTINRDAFLTGRRGAPAQVRENPFLKERPSYGAPPIRPIRTTLMPIVRDIPPAKRPPERIREAQSFSPAQNEHRKGPVGSAPLGQKGPGPAAPSEQKKIGSPIGGPPRQGPANVGRPGGGPQTKQEETHEQQGDRESGAGQTAGWIEPAGPCRERNSTGPQRDCRPGAPRKKLEKEGRRRHRSAGQKDQSPPSTGPVAPSGQRGAPVGQDSRGAARHGLGQPGRETMGGSVGGQPPQGRPGIAPRQGQVQVSGPAGQTPAWTIGVDEARPTAARGPRAPSVRAVP